MNQSKTIVPLYIRIAEGLLDRIQSGNLAPGDQLPPERELSATLDVNRRTVREALRVLETQGLLIRQQGVGTFIAHPKVERETSYLVPFTKGMQSRGYLIGAKLVLFKQQMCTVSVAEQMNLPISSLIYYVHRLRFLNNEPTMLEKFILPAACFPKFEQYDLENRSLYEILKTEYGVIISQARQNVEAVRATEYEATLLGVESGSPLLLEQRLGLDQNGRPVEYAKDLYRGDRFRFVTQVTILDEQGE